MPKDDEVAARIKETAEGEPEGDHVRADAILIELLMSLGYHKTVAAWNEVEKWYA